MQLIDRVCGALFNCYRTEETDLHLFVLLFLPHLIYSYLNSIAHVDKQVRYTTQLKYSSYVLILFLS